MENITAQMFSKQFRIGNKGISEWNKAQIEAKANAIGLTDSLKNEVLAMASDADITDKMRTGKITWAKAIADSGDDIDKVADALKNSGKISDEWIETLNKCNPDELKQRLLDCVNATDGLGNSMASLGSKTASNSFFDNLKSQAKGAIVALKSVLPVLTAVGVAYGAYKLWDYSQTGYTRAKEKAEAWVM